MKTIWMGCLVALASMLPACESANAQPVGSAGDAKAGSAKRDFAKPEFKTIKEGGTLDSRGIARLLGGEKSVGLRQFELKGAFGDPLDKELKWNPKVTMQQIIPGEKSGTALNDALKSPLPAVVTARGDADLLLHPDQNEPRSVRQVGCDERIAAMQAAFDSWRKAAIDADPLRRIDKKFPSTLEQFVRWYPVTKDQVARQAAVGFLATLRAALAACFDATAPADLPRDVVGALSGADDVAYCTVVRISPGVVATARHCVEPYDVRLDDRQVAQLRVRYGERVDAVRAYHRIDPTSGRFVPDDWVLLKVDGRGGDSVVPILSSGGIATGTRIVVGGVAMSTTSEPARPVFASTLSCVVVYATSTCVVHTCNTLPGMSGAPIFVRGDRGWALAGLHSRAMQPHDLAYCPAPDTMSRRVPINGGIHANVLPR